MNSAMGYEAFMDGNGDVEGDYALVALNPLDSVAPEKNPARGGLSWFSNISATRRAAQMLPWQTHNGKPNLQ